MNGGRADSRGCPHTGERKSRTSLTESIVKIFTAYFYRIEAIVHSNIQVFHIIILGHTSSDSILTGHRNDLFFSTAIVESL